MTPVGLILCACLAAIPPLTDDEAARLGTAADGVDRRGDAFAALVENVARWVPATVDAASLPAPDLDRIVADPAAQRGAVYRVAGRIQQQVPLAYPYENVVEWFVRDDAGRPMIVYVRGLGPGHGFRDGRAVVVPARFYKRVDAEARDGRLHRYAAFVGAFPRPAGEGGGWGRLWVVTVLVVVMLVVFLLLLLYARRGQGPMRARAVIGGPWPGAGDDGLPDDPAEALAELRRRAEADE
jgi:hypothetical protein